jgi:mannonate dehydratase
MAAGLHLGLAIHNFGIQEFAPHSAETYQVFPRSYSFADGYLHPGDEPGLGVALDREVAAKFPYEAAYLPVNRLVDGTVHDW